ncbi:SPASM domain-containing protein [bacterium]|nr:SPASM domain-containing protein [bacterium]
MESATKVVSVQTRLIAKAFCSLLCERTFQEIRIIDALITEDCNCRCDYCFIEGKHPQRMTEGIVKATVDFALLKSRNLRTVEILLFGGEPLTAFDLMQLTVEYGDYRAALMGKRISYSMTTNGTLFDEEKLSFCHKHGIKFLLSIDGDEETHNTHRKFADGRGTYRTIAEKIPLMKQYQPWLGARVTPTPKNMHKLHKNIVHLHQLGINQVLIGPASGLPYSDGDVAELRRQLADIGTYYIAQKKKRIPFRFTHFEKDGDGAPNKYRGFWGCGAGRGRISVSASGEIQPCAKVQGLNGLAGIPEFSLGNVLTGFTNLDARREFIAFRYDLRKACHNCDLKDDCAGGCPAVNYKATGSIFLPDPCECKLTRAHIEVKREVIAKLEAEGLA